MHRSFDRLRRLMPPLYLKVSQYCLSSAPSVCALGELLIRHGVDHLGRYCRCAALVEELRLGRLYVTVERAYLLADIAAPAAARFGDHLLLICGQLALFFASDTRGRSDPFRDMLSCSARIGGSVISDSPSARGSSGSERNISPMNI